MRDSRLLPMKGVARGAALVGTRAAVDMTAGGKKLRRGVRVYSVVGGIAKLEFYNHLRKTIEVTEDGEILYPAGYVHLPRSMSSSSRSCSAIGHVGARDGSSVREWQKIRERDEALDCYVYAPAAHEPSWS